LSSVRVVAALLENTTSGCGLAKTYKARVAQVHKDDIKLADHLRSGQRGEVARCCLDFSCEVHEALERREFVNPTLQTHYIPIANIRRTRLGKASTSDAIVEARESLASGVKPRSSRSLGENCRMIPLSFSQECDIAGF